MSEDKEVIVVKGARPKPTTGLESEKDAGGFSPFVPDFIRAANWDSGLGGAELPVRVRLFTRDGFIVFRFEEFGIELKIPQNEWSAMSAQQQRVITYVLQHYDRSDRLEAALRHYANEGVSEIVLRYGTEGTNYDGSKYQFQTFPDGRSAIAQVSYDWEKSDETQTDLKPGSSIVISLNSNNIYTTISESLAKAIIHELLHPWVPDTLQSDGTFGDHEQINQYTQEEFGDIFPGPGPASLPPGGEESIAYLGSRHGDSDIGGNGNDVMAGMEGNDVLDGVGGDDVLAGGPGMDTLIAGSGFSDLRGGLDADTYVAAAVDANFYVDDTGGVDRVRIAGSGADFIVARNGDNLSIWSNNQGYAYEIRRLRCRPLLQEPRRRVASERRARRAALCRAGRDIDSRAGGVRRVGCFVMPLDGNCWRQPELRL